MPEKPVIIITEAAGGNAIEARVKFGTGSINGYGHDEDEAIASLMQTLAEIHDYSSDRKDYEVRRLES